MKSSPLFLILTRNDLFYWQNSFRVSWQQWQAIRNGVRKNQTQALYKMANLYLTGCRVQRNYAKAYVLYAKAAWQGHAAALNNMAVMNDLGLGRVKNQKMALMFYNVSAPHGLVQAQFNLGHYHYNSHHKAADSLAQMWFTMAAKQQYPKALLYLGDIHEFVHGGKDNMKRAFAYYHQAAILGNYIAQCSVAICYEEGKGTRKNYSQAKKWYVLSAKQGYSYAQNRLALMYNLGHGVQKNSAKAIQWYQRAAKQNNLDAMHNLANLYRKKGFMKKALACRHNACRVGGAEQMFNLGMEYRKCYEKDIDVSNSKEQALYWYTQAAQANYVDAQFVLGSMYEEGDMVEENPQLAFFWFLRAAKNHDLTATWLVGHYYETAYGVAQDLSLARQYYHKAAKRGDREAQYCYARLLKYGQGGQQNLQQALFWYKKAAKTGHTDAQFALGFIYLSMSGRICRKNAAKAIAYLQLAAHSNRDGIAWCLAVAYETMQEYVSARKWYLKDFQQTDSGVSACSLACLYRDGLGGKRNSQKAKRYFLIAAEKGDVDAQYLLALMYDKGDGIKQNRALAEKWYLAAAQQYHIDAMYNLGLLYDNQANYQVARKWYRQGAKLGERDSQNNLALLYQNGLGGPVDLKKAYRLFALAAHNGNSHGMANLGVMYLQGNGVVKDTAKALHFLHLAAEQNNDFAQEQLGQIYSEGVLVKQDKKLAKKWFKKASHKQ